jgi:hypothetical protein
MKIEPNDRSRLAKNAKEYNDLLAGSDDWLARTADDVRQLRQAKEGVYAIPSERDFEEFVNSLTFNRGGVASGSYKPLMASLTLTEIFEVFERFGMGRGLALETLEAECINHECKFDFWSFCASNC